jgi:Tfp pilus assembly protein PilN
MSKSPRTSRLVVAAVKDDAQFKAVEVRSQDGVTEIVWAKALSSEGRTWSDFAAHCGFSDEFGSRRRTAMADVTVVIGMDSTAVAFYRITAPAVSKEETAAIVRMQAESLLPLPPEQIEVAWRTLAATNGKVDVTIAAARSDHLERFADSVRDFQPHRILLSCEGVVQAWQRLFAGREPEAVVVSLGQRATQVCLVQAGQLVHAAVLDAGMNELADDVLDPSQTAERMERFAMHVRAVLDCFGGGGSATWPVFILSDGSEVFGRMAASLSTAGLCATARLPSLSDLKGPPGFETADLYEYRAPLGLALLATEEPAEGLNLFTGILQDRTQASAGQTRRSLILAGAIALFMLVLLIATSYAVDRARDTRYKELLAQTDLGQAKQRQSLLRTVAQHRPDLLQLFADVGGDPDTGVVLDSFHFKKGQPVSLTGQADNEEQMWKLQENLRARKGLQDVEISNASRDAKKIKFTITFQYRSFTKKEAVL